VVSLIGVAVFAVAARLRRAKLDPDRDRLAQPDGDAGQGRPRHLRVESDQRSRFVSHR
jgi:hypothetical protein